MIITGKQCQMCRIGLGLGIRELATMSKVSPNTIVRMEKGEELKRSTIKKIQEVIEKEGAQFFEANSMIGVAIPKTEESEVPSIF